MSICGRAGLSANGLAPIDRSLSALSLGPARLQKRWRGEDVELGSCDDSALALASPGLAAVFDGRIDNREDLRALLGAEAVDRRTTAEIAISAYRKLGDDFCDRIIGDYACAVWDGPRRRLVMATDPGALRPLVYWTHQGEILFASEERGLWPDPRIERRLDEDQMAAWLSMLPRNPESTFFEGIFRVPPGRRVIWEAGRTRLERWWRPEETPELRLSRDRDYEEAMLESLDQAVACRIPVEGRIGSHLSAGLDSAAVTAMAARRLAADGRRLTAFTAAPSHDMPESKVSIFDEWPLAALTAEMYPNIEHLRIANDAAPLLSALAVRETGSDWPVRNTINTSWIDGINGAARDRRIGVVLTGQMGNMTISYGGGEWLASRLQRGDGPGALRAVGMLRAGGSTWRSVAGEAIDVLLPQTLSRAVRRAFGAPQSGLYDLSLVNRAFLDKRGLTERAEAVACNLRNEARGDGRALRLAVFDRADHIGSYAAGTRRLFGVDLRDPTADRRLIELCLSIPEEQYAKGGQRSLVRRAMKGVLPAAVLAERRKGRQAADWGVSFRAALPGLHEEVSRLRNSAFARECLDLDRMQALLDAWPGPDGAACKWQENHRACLSRALGVGRFIRRLEGGNA